MNRVILKQASIKLKKILRKYDVFATVFLDDWRGYRFIYDIEKSDCCINGCKKCPVYRLLKDEKVAKGFTAGLYPASNEEKRFFGQQKFLNCKTFNEYQNCYINFLLKKCDTKKEIFAELNLIKNMKILYTKNGSPVKKELQFKKNVIKKTLASAEPMKKKTIRGYLNLNSDFY